MDDLTQLAQQCGATIYRNRLTPQSPAVAFGDEAWAKFQAEVQAQPTMIPVTAYDRLQALCDSQAQRIIELEDNQAQAEAVPQDHPLYVFASEVAFGAYRYSELPAKAKAALAAAAPQPKEQT